MSGQYRLATLGCKVNQYESQLLREVLESFGMRPADEDAVAAVAVVNTCAVTRQATRRNRHAIRRLSRGGRIPVVVVGCGASADGEHLRRLPGVSAVFGHDADVCAELRDFLQRRLNLVQGPDRPDAIGVVSHDPPSAQTGEDDGWMMADVHRASRTTKASRTTNQHTILPLPVVKTPAVLLGRIEAFAGHQRAFLKVQDGCDAHCTYCIIPRLRNLPRSKPIELAVDEARDLVRAGHREIILTGIFLGAYGRDSALRRRWPAGPSPLAGLVAAIARVDGLARLRLSSLEPGDMDGALLKVIAENEVCVPHFHLPLQSGSDAVLTRMNRQYTRAEFVDMIDRVRNALDRPAISTDIIVGFPGESDKDFAASLEVAEYADFIKIHAFPFSPREQTAAARWQKDFVTSAFVRERMHRLAEIERDGSLRFRRRMLGACERVIIERDGDDSEIHNTRAVADRIAPVADFDHRFRHGRSDRYFDIHFEAPELSPGEVVNVRIDRVTPTRTHGTRIDRTSADYPLHVLP
jgi:threonylcarbamoyladenosine tRNA methylthiotransferase MtaB